VNGGPRLSVALGEYDTGWHDPKASIAAAEHVVGRAAGVGAELVVLPEMATTGFTMDPAQAVALDSPDVNALCGIASRHRVWLIAGMALRDEAAVPAGAVNGALAIDPSGRVAAVHHKQRLFAFAGEDQSYESGHQSTVVEINDVAVGLFICYELRFPEVFAPVANEVSAMIVIANWPAARQEHWDTLLRARAIENQCFVVGVNRTGTADSLKYDGGSVAYDPLGARLVPPASSGVRLVSVDAGQVRAVRERFPFLRDRRT
jgi:predicted amidohydrolase